MRSLFVKDLSSIKDHYLVMGKDAHHLLNVVRVKVNEEILMLNGEGLKVKCIVEEVTKREVALKLTNQIEEEDQRWLDLAYGITKKDAVDLALKISCEIGISNFFPLITEYSQKKMIKIQRVQSILESSISQSNSAFFPHISKELNIKELSLLFSKYESIFVMDLSLSSTKYNEKLTGKSLLIIGPEGGFSENDLKILKEHRVHFIKLPMNILRAPTAVAAGAGYISSIR